MLSCTKLHSCVQGPNIFVVFLQADKTIWTSANLCLVSVFVVIAKHLNINQHGLNLLAVDVVTQTVFFTSLKKAGTQLSFALRCFLSIN